MTCSLLRTPVGGSTGGDKSWGSIKCRKFLDWLQTVAFQEGICFLELFIYLFI